MSKLKMARLARFIALDTLHSFAHFAKIDPDFTSSHDPKPTQFDETVTIQFEGMNRRNNGEEEFVFVFLKPGCFAIWAALPDADITFPSVTVFGDVAAAKLFLTDLRAHHNALGMFRHNL